MLVVVPTMRVTEQVWPAGYLHGQFFTHSKTTWELEDPIGWRFPAPSIVHQASWDTNVLEDEWMQEWVSPHAATASLGFGSTMWPHWRHER